MKFTSPFGLERRVLVPLEIALLLACTGVAVYLWTGPRRAERRLSRASFPDLVSASKREPNNPRVFYYLGVRLRQLSQDGPAKAAFARAASLDKDDEDAWLAWAASSAEFTGDQDAFGILTMYSKAHPDSVRAHFALALLYQQKQAFQRAFDEAKEVTRLDPKNTGALRLIGTAGLDLLKYSEAADALNKAVALEGNDWRNRYLLGSVWEAEHKYADAIATYQKAVALAPKEVRPLVALGRARMRIATSDTLLHEAIGSLETAAQLDPGDVAAATELGKAYLRAKRYAEARAILQRAEQLAPRSAEIAFSLKQVAEQSGDKAEAARYDRIHQQLQASGLARYNLYSQVWQNPKDSALRLKYARFCAGQGDYRAAADSYQRLLALHPGAAMEKQVDAEMRTLHEAHPEAFAVQSLSLPMPAAATTSERPTADLLKDAADMLAHKRYAEAEQTYQAIVARDPSSAAACEGLGLAYDAQNKVDLAFATLTKALQLDPTLIKAQYRVAGIYYESNFPEEATKRMERVVRKVADNADYWHALGLGAMTVGTGNRMQLAQKAFTKAAALAPGNPIYLRDQAIIEEKNGRFADAEAHYRQALKIAPDDVTILQSLGSCLADHQPTSSRLAEAEYLLRRAYKVKPRDPLVLAALGGVRLSRGDAKEAVNFLEEAVMRSSGDTTTWYRLARAYEKLGNRERSAYCLKAFREVTGMKARLANTEEAARMHLKDPKRRLDLARVYAESGQNARAINQYQMAVSLDPSNQAVKKEMDDYTAKLKARGEMPEMSKFNGMLLASVAQEKVNRGFTKETSGAN